MNFSPAARVKRYSAKMVTHLAEKLFDGLGSNQSLRVVDPFCGSGEILLAAQRLGIKSVGFDVNPYATLLSQVQLERFDIVEASELMSELVSSYASHESQMHLSIENAEYWFPGLALNNLRRLKSLACKMALYKTASGRSVLLSLAQCVRLVSYADNRSPKPFISRSARSQKLGVYRDPLEYSRVMHGAICIAFGGRTCGSVSSKPWLADASSSEAWKIVQGSYTHAITSPPYINAQDYFRNFKFEIGFLADLVPEFGANIAGKFIGRERGLRGTAVDELGALAVDYFDELNPSLRAIRLDYPKLGAILYKYFFDMRQVFSVMHEYLEVAAEVRLVCSDNLIRGYNIPTGKILCQLLQPHGFEIKARFDDSIRVRYLAPKRAGHEALMRAETIYYLRRG